jgi:hypothetical protein
MLSFLEENDRAAEPAADESEKRSGKPGPRDGDVEILQRRRSLRDRRCEIF